MKYYLYPNAAYHVFTDCFEKAGVALTEKEKLESLGWNKLRNDIKRKIEYKPLNSAGKLYPDEFWDKFWREYHDDLRDRFWEICKLIREGKEHKKKGFDEFKFLPLLMYLGVTDYEEYNERYKPVIDTPSGSTLSTEALDEKLSQIAGLVEEEIAPLVISSVFYATKPFSRFNFLRIPDDEGVLYFYGNTGIEFKGKDKNIKIAASGIQHLEDFSMNDGPERLWVKVEYAAEGQLTIAYFAEYQSGPDGLKLSTSQNLCKHFNQLLSTQHLSV
jgi:hypothetical protein